MPPPPKPDYNQCKLIKNDERLDCYPEDGANSQACEARGCCWLSPKGGSKHFRKKMNISLTMPYCFYPSNYQTYTYINITETAYGVVAFLKRNYASSFPDDVELLKMTAKYETENRLHIKVNIININNVLFLFNVEIILFKYAFLNSCCNFE